MGSCPCGAVYACDETGHNLGSAMIEALVFACNMDWDLAWGLLPDEDYLQEIVKDYDYANHLVVPGGFFERRRISGALFFIRAHQDVQEVTSEGVRKRLERAATATAITESSRKGRSKKGSFSRQEIEELVRELNLDPMLDVAGEDRRLVRNLHRLLYSGDDLFRNRAAETLGRVSAIIAKKEPGTISKLLQRLFYAIVDTAAFTWGAFEAIGEIIGHRVDLFGGYVPQLYQFLPDETLRAHAIEALGRIAKSSPGPMRRHTFHFLSFLNDPDPAVRGYTARLLGNLGAQEAKGALKRLQDDPNEVKVYENGDLLKRTVGQLASDALDRL